MKPHPKKSNLRDISDNLVQLIPSLKGQKLCDLCRKKLGKIAADNGQINNDDNVNELVGDPKPHCSRDIIQANDIDRIDSVDRLSMDEPNDPLTQCSSQSESTIYSASQSTHKSNASDSSYCPSPLKKRKCEPQVEITEDVLEFADAGREILSQLKEKLDQPTTTNAEKIVILGLAPKSWSIRKTSQFFNVSRTMADKAKKLVNSDGILTSPNQFRGKKMAKETIDLVSEFYEHDSNSRQMAGRKDFVSVKQSDGSRKHVQKRLIYCNLSELYQSFMEKYPQSTIGFSTFAKLRPAHCILAGASGTHTVCVCVQHENVKLMLESVNFSELTKDSEYHLKTHRDFINLIICDSPSPNCYLGKCDTCPGTDRLTTHLQRVFDENNIERIEFHNWTETDRAELKVNILPTDTFIEQLCAKILKLKTHAFIATQQSDYFDYIKQSLQPNEFIIQCDFAENYGFIAQNAIQTFHWNNNQCTIYTVMYYYKDGDELKHGSMAILSDDLRHNTSAVFSFHSKIIQRLKEKFTPTKIIYFSDGAAQHFKNRYNFSNIKEHERDFGIPAEWHFFGTAHGKGACDGIGGNLKRLAAKASLQASTSAEQILNPSALFEWASKYLEKTAVLFSSKMENDVVAAKLDDRFTSAKPIPGTREYHGIIPNDCGQLVLKKFSFAQQADLFPKLKKLSKRRSRS